MSEIECDLTEPETYMSYGLNLQWEIFVSVPKEAISIMLKQCSESAQEGLMKLWNKYNR